MRRTLATLAAATTALLLLAPGVATPQGGIVIHGARSGTHLRLWLRGDVLRVRGAMSRRTEGCHFVRGHRAAACPLRYAGGVTVVTGPVSDKVRVLERLPLPLTAHLGKGSDKLIGNGERDTCYPQGTRRNRCVGGPGNDICISANVNTDCIGGAGNDYCHTGDGSDGCWGGPGQDTCAMGPGEDGCHGEAGRDRLYGGPGADQLYGGPGADLCEGAPGRGRQHECELRPPPRN